MDPNVYYINSLGTSQIVFPSRDSVHIPQSSSTLTGTTNEALVVTCTSKSRFASGRARELIDNWADHHLDLPTYLYTDRLRRYPTRDINHCVSWVDLGVIEAAGCSA